MGCWGEQAPLSRGAVLPALAVCRKIWGFSGAAAHFSKAEVPWGGQVWQWGE